MRVRITRRLPVSYDRTGNSLRMGRMYDLPSELAGALVLEGFAEFIESDESKHLHGEGFTSEAVHDRRSARCNPKPRTT